VFGAEVGPVRGTGRGWGDLGGLLEPVEEAADLVGQEIPATPVGGHENAKEKNSETHFDHDALLPEA
jgi:hypothetical protein